MRFIFSIFLLVFTSVITAQEVFNWQNYTDMKNVVSSETTGKGIWAATSGGAFFYNSTTKEFKTLHKTDGLYTSSLNAVTIDADGKTWFGGDDGTLDSYDPLTAQMKTILDIYNSDKTLKGINELKSSGDTIFVSSDFGLSLVDSRNYIFHDTFFKFGSFPPYTKVNSSFKAGILYLATSAGAAIQKTGAVNLSAPESWNTYTNLNGLPSSNVTKIIKLNSSVIAATDKGLSILNDTTWSSFLPQFNNVIINDLLIKSDSLFIAAGKKVYLYSNNIVTVYDSASITLNKISYSNSLGLIASTSNGILILNNKTYLFPNGPQANKFPQLCVDNSGNLWSSSGKNNQGIGFYKFDGKTWTNYNKGNTPQLPSNDYYFINSTSDNVVYAGNWGSGFARVKGNDLAIFTKSNTPLVGIPINANFIVASGFSKDSRNNLWIMNYWPADGRALAMLTPDSTWRLFQNPAELGRSFEQHYYLTIDPYDTKWYAIRDEQRLGLYYFNENGTYTDSIDDKFDYINAADGLNSNFIYAVVADKRGDIWVGTNLGVNIISNTGSVLSNNPQLSISSVFTLRQQSINAIAVDPLDNKWIGTNEGLLLVNSDGSALLSTYNTTNSPLLSDVITSLAIDENTGRVYVGSDAGLTSFDTPSLKPVDSFTDLFVYPNPFIVNNGSKNLTIDGLIKDSEIKILNIEGKLIREFSSPGGRIAFWDGKDENGNFVNSGIYFVVAFDMEGNNVTTGKVAVLHK
jgi:ligand-binding sensor domain-containing protein